jgi:ATP-dependent protease ClpP protease subunit
MLPRAMMMLHQLRTGAPTYPQPIHHHADMLWSVQFIKKQNIIAIACTFEG